MKQRTITGLALTAFLAVMLWLPGWCMAIAVMVCVSLAMYEEMQALKKAGHDLVNWPTWAAMVLSVPLTYFLTQKIMIPLIMSRRISTTLLTTWISNPLWKENNRKVCHSAHLFLMYCGMPMTAKVLK